MTGEWVAVLPGQGGARARSGMTLRRLCPAALVEADLIGRHLSKDMFRWFDRVTEGDLQDVVVSHLATFAHGAICYAEAVERLGEPPRAFLGHSLGSITAAYCGGMLSLEDALALVEGRGRLVERYGKTGSLFALVARGERTVADFVEAVSGSLDVYVALINAPTWWVVGCRERDAGALVAEARRTPLMRLRSLGLTVPYHTPLLAEVRGHWERHLRTIELEAPSAPIAVNCLGSLSAGLAAIRVDFGRQLTTTVHWDKCVNAARAAYPDAAFVEADVTPGLVRLGRMNVGVDAFSIGQLPSVERLPGKGRVRCARKYRDG